LAYFKHTPLHQVSFDDTDTDTPCCDVTFIIKLLKAPSVRINKIFKWSNLFYLCWCRKCNSYFPKQFKTGNYCSKRAKHCCLTLLLTPSLPLCYLVIVSQPPSFIECHILFEWPLTLKSNFHKKFSKNILEFFLLWS